MVRLFFNQLNRLWWVGIFAVVGIVLLGAFVSATWQLRQKTLDDALDSTRIYAHSLEDSLTQSLRAMELSSQTLQEQLDGQSTSIENIEFLLKQSLRSMPAVRSFSIIDETGRVLASSNSDNAGQTADLASIYPVSDPTSRVLRVGLPLMGRDWADLTDSSKLPETLVAEDSFVPIYLPLTINQRQLWWVAALNADYFRTQANLLFSTDAVHADWIRYDGTYLWGTTRDTSAASSHAALLATRLDVQDFATFISNDPQWGSPHLISYRASSRYPLVVNIWLPETLALAPWVKDSQRRVLSLAPLVLLVSVLGWGLWVYRSKLRLQQTLLDQERQLAQQVVVNASDAIVVTDANGRIESVNPAFEALTGFSARQALGQNPRILASGQYNRDFFVDIFTQVSEQGFWKGCMVNRHANGTLYTARMSIDAIRNERGEVTHYSGTLANITQEQRLQNALQESEERMKLALESGGLGAWDWNVSTGQVVVTARWCEIVGIPIQSEINIKDWICRLHPQEQYQVNKQLKEHLYGESPSFVHEHQLLHTDGRWIWVLDKGLVTQRDAQGKPLRMIGTHLDITARKQADDDLKLAASVFSHAQEAIMITDAQGLIIDVNTAFEAITGYERHEVMGRSTHMLNSGRQSQAFYEEMWGHLTTHGSWTGELWNRRKSGEIYAELLTISAVKDFDGKVLRHVALFSDITRQKEHEQRLECIAHFDVLTGLPNRSLLSDRLELAMVQSERRKKILAVVFLDLDGFKSINDTHGHDAGDQLLIALAARMKQALREGDTLARLGGDEFVAVLVDLDNHQDCNPVLERLRISAAKPVHIHGYPQLQVSASLGITFFPQSEGMSSDQLMRQADQAMYQSKISGKNRYNVFDATNDQTLRERHETLDNLRLALELRQFVLHYQPKVNMRTGQVLGVEALVRWNHPQLGLLPPSRFLPLIQNHSLGLALGEWILNEALAQIEAWKLQNLQLPISINLDAQQLSRNLVPTLKTALQLHPMVNPGDLRLEVLESNALNDLEDVSLLIRECLALGVQFSLDDFGTGYSSLAYLRRLPAQELKIDQSFVRDMLEDPDDLAILQGILGLARAFHRSVIAEGVETIAHGCMLLRMGCENAQGYAIAKPMAAIDLIEWFHSWKSPCQWLDVPRLRVDHQFLLFAQAGIRRCHLSRQPLQLSHLQAIDGYMEQWLQTLAPEHHCRQKKGFLRLQHSLQLMRQHTSPLCAPTATAFSNSLSDEPQHQLKQLCENMEIALEELISSEL